MPAAAHKPHALLAVAQVALLSCALLFAPAAKADFVQGVRAYEAGDHKAAYEAWLPLANRGDVAAMRNIGHLYRWGQGVEKDIAQAIHWYRLAAEKGFSRAQANLAAIYLQGEEGTPVDYDEAHKWFAAAAVQNLAVAQYNLGLMYELGLGVEKNEARALGWYNLAAKSGQPEAIERLSQLVKATEPPLVSGVNLPVAETAAPPVPAAQTPVPQMPVPQAAAADSKTETAATMPAQPATPAPPPVVAAPAEPPATLPSPPAADEQPADDGRPGFLSRFYSAISSGGGVSIPDIFTSSPDETAEPPADGQDSKP
ncbi:sel1 repeat family protein [Ferrovibrio terrae]|uniref:Sel1 repeat family protein n=1 Tax=Ferrovibrio terrae TaxID=2594003 RepID=A0A516GYT0_9PROT|nr:tetratricopeptide repeat protein [Ferrovibrio terrae]QDO96676.1 sel1 repeat family protein [Ferrovibrio terrae]